MFNSAKLLRMAKIVLLGTSALYFTLVAFSNLTDYGTNFAFVQHVLMMDTTFQDPDLMWRAIDDPIVHHAFYWSIIIWELAAAVLCWIGVVQLARTFGKSNAKFNEAKCFGFAGLGVGLMLWFFAFMTVGGEWFVMWQSDSWNGLDAAFRMFAVMGIVLLLLARKD